MSFIRPTFLGATVRSFSSSIGWGGQVGQLTIQLVNDPLNNDNFSPPLPLQPVYFQFYGFTFSGLLQQWKEGRDINGRPVFSVTVVDPREILDGTEVIISAYSGSTGSIPNLLNAYGYWENQGFGSSQENDAGMPWPNIASAITTMVNTPLSSGYGGPLNYQGVSYGLDLSHLPSPPITYRMGGVSINLLQAISQVCEDGACDFFVDLVGYMIVIRTVSRLNQPPLGTITKFINANQGGIVTRSDNGLEGRNEIMSSFLVGGEISTLNLTDNITQFWGYDFNGDPITSTPTVLKLKDSAGKALLSVNCETMSLNASSIADIIGRTVYNCTTFEMRLALGSNQETWRTYMTNYRPQDAQTIGLIGSFVAPAAAAPSGNNPASPTMKQDIINDAKAPDIASRAIQGNQEITSQRVYDFVRGYAEEYMGKKFLVGLPFIMQYQDQETLKVINSYDVADSGYLDEGSEPLGLSSLNEDTFKEADGRFRAFVEFNNLSSVDFSALPPNGIVLQLDSRENPTTLFMEVHVDPNIIFFEQTPYAVITLPAVLFNQAFDVSGDSQAVQGVSQIPGTNNVYLQTVANQYMSGPEIHPDYNLPGFVAVPLRSNIFTYGPWFVAGSPGKVKFDYDPELTPWNYGGMSFMQDAGASRVMTSVSNMNVIETGSLELAEAPRCSLGNLLQFGGPNVTDINMEYGISGITTTYRFATFTQRFGVFSKSNSERMKRLALTQQSLRRSVRAALRQDYVDSAVMTGVGVRSFLKGAPKWSKKQSPHETLVSYSLFDANNNIVRHTMQTATMEETLGLSNANNNTAFGSTAIMGMNGLLRPFSTNLNGATGAYLPSYTRPLLQADVPTQGTLDPFKQQGDIEIYAWGSTYAGIVGRRHGGDLTNARVMALRGPLIVSGWGYGTDCGKWPGDGNGNWASNYIQRSDLWKVGPVDLLWDDKRGVWTPHGNVRGNIKGAITPGQNGTMTVTPISPVTGAPWTITVWNGFRTTVSGDPNTGILAHATYMAHDNRWYINALDC